MILTRHLIETELQKGKYVCLVQLDLSLAFDTIECEFILPSKMKHYGFNQTAISFFNSFFLERYHYTDWRGAKSDPIPLSNHSCVQGSSLGSFFYNLYSQDLQNVTDCSCINFADDTELLLSHKDPNELIKLMNKDLGKMSEYMNENTLIINQDKSVYLIFKPKGAKDTAIKEKLSINGNEIIRVQNTKFLGTWIDDRMKFYKQVQMVTKKLENTVRALICVRNTLNYRAKLLVYNSLFKSISEYNAIAYFDKINKTQLNDLSKLQKNAVRLIFSSKRSVHTDKLLKLANIRPIEKMYEEEAIKFVFKYINDTNKEQPKAIETLFFKQKTIHRNLRSYDDESKIKINDQYRKGQCLFNLLDTWNKTDFSTKSAGNVWSLKLMLKEKLSNDVRTCHKKKCFACALDSKRNYESYMKK
jgi:hypothetical protein